MTAPTPQTESELMDQLLDEIPSMQELLGTEGDELKESIQSLCYEIAQVFENPQPEFKDQQRADYFLHGRPENVSRAEHVATYPHGGVDAFLEYLREFAAYEAKSIHEACTKLIDPEKPLIEFAQVISKNDSGNLREVMHQEGCTSENEAYVEQLIEMLNYAPSDHPVKVSTLCAYLCLGVPNISIEWLTDALFKKTCSDSEMAEIIEEARKIQILRQESSQRGKKGIASRDQNKLKVRAYAIELASKRSYSSFRQAAKAIVNEVWDYSVKLGCNYAGKEQLERNIASWLSADAKSKAAQSDGCSG